MKARNNSAVLATPPDRHQEFDDSSDNAPKGYNLVWYFSELWPKPTCNRLLQDDDGQFYLQRGMDGELHKVSVKQALEWYARCMPFSDCGSGDLVELCEAAAKLLK